MDSHILVTQAATNLKTPSPVNETTGHISTAQSGGQKFFLFTLEFFLRFEFLLAGVTCVVLYTTGILTNIINIIVFLKMGLSSTTNIMFFALSVNDLVLLIACSIHSWALSGALDGINKIFLNISDLGLMLNPLTWPCFSIGSTVTALIVVERSLCIMLPFKVKMICTRKRIIFAIILLTVYALGSAGMKYASITLEWQRVPTTNATRLVMVYTDEYIAQTLLGSLIFTVIPSVGSFVFIITGTIFMVVKLQESARWRGGASSSGDAGSKSISTKELKVIRCAVSVCIMYIICFTPNVGIMTVDFIVPSLHINDPQFSLFMYSMYYISYFCQNVSSSSNIFIYLAFNSKFKKTFQQVFCCSRKN